MRTWSILPALLALHSAAWAADRRPNVLLVVADDLRADVTSVYGGPVKVPNLEALAARGAVFDRATCGYPICHIARTELITGRCVVTEASRGGSVAFRPEWRPWPQVVRQAGWQTVYAGKWHVAGTPWTRAATSRPRASTAAAGRRGNRSPCRRARRAGR